MYSARVILSVEAMTAAVQVWDREKKMLTVAQTIGTNQIPLPAQVGHFKYIWQKINSTYHFMVTNKTYATL